MIKKANKKMHLKSQTTYNSRNMKLTNKLINTKEFHQASNRLASYKLMSKIYIFIFFCKGLKVWV